MFSLLLSTWIFTADVSMCNAIFDMSICLYAVQWIFFRGYSCVQMCVSLLFISSKIEIFPFVIYFLLRIRQTHHSIGCVPWPEDNVSAKMFRTVRLPWPMDRHIYTCQAVLSLCACCCCWPRVCLIDIQNLSCQRFDKPKVEQKYYHRFDKPNVRVW